MKAKLVKTRKEHSCTLCHRIIPKGKIAEQVLHRWVRKYPGTDNHEGYISKKYYCMDCFNDHHAITEPRDDYGYFTVRRKTKVLVAGGKILSLKDVLGEKEYKKLVLQAV